MVRGSNGPPPPPEPIDNGMEVEVAGHVVPAKTNLILRML